MEPIATFGETHDVEITLLVENRADLLLESTETVKRFTRKPLLAEHGFAALIDLKAAGQRILWDAGIGSTALVHNARQMEIDLASVDKIALSHGHGDHFGALGEVLARAVHRPEAQEWAPDVPIHEIEAYVQGQRIPLIAHPAAFRERWKVDEDGKKFGPHTVPLEVWEAAGARVILSEEPYQLGPGCWLTGTVPRTSFEKAGLSSTRAYRSGYEFLPDRLEDDQSVALVIRDKGLVVLTGCAHAGIVNTVEHARHISGVDRVWAVVGGFHLAGAAEDEIERTVEAIARFEPAMIVPCHCTGFEATARFAAHLPEQFVQGAVGTALIV